MTNLSTLPAEPAWAAFAAIDWAAQTHSWALQPALSNLVESGKLDNTPEAVELWATNLRNRFPGPVAIAIEQKRGSVVYMLSKYDHLVLYPVPPSMSAAYRKTCHPSGAKTDAADAKLLLDLLIKHRDLLRPRTLDTPETRLLQFLVEQRRQLVQQKVRCVQRLIDSVQQYFPQVRTWFPNLDTLLVDSFLRRWPTLNDLQRSHPGTLRRFFTDHSSHKDEWIRQRMESIYAAVMATDDPVVIEAGSRKTAACLNHIRDLRRDISELEHRIADVTANHPDAPIFASFPGAGAATVPRLIAAFGTCRETWASAAAMQQFSGIAPVHKSSGKTTLVVMRRACPAFVRQTFHEFAKQSIACSEWAKAYYLHQRQNLKKGHHAALRALAFRWIRILYRCWKDRLLYDERLFTESQRLRSSLFGRNTPAEQPLCWGAVAGFQKLTSK